MKDKLIIRDLGDLDGEYAFNLAELLTVGEPEFFTNHELRWIKLETGILAGQLSDAMLGGDNDLNVMIAAVVLRRHDKQFDLARLWEAPAGRAIEFDIGQEDDAVPPPLRSDEPPSTAAVSSGNGSTSGSELQENDQSPTGHPESGKSADSDQPIWATSP